VTELQIPAASDNEAADEFLSEVLQGLAAPQKRLPGKYLWDERGSELFDEITRSPGYYATSTEMGLLAGCVAEIARIVGPDVAVVELGSGATHKVGLLLDALESPRHYIGIDISAEFTAAAAARLRVAYPSLHVEYVYADYSRELPPLPLDRAQTVLGFLPGSTIGNMEPEQTADLLARIRRALGSSYLLIGQDSNHDVSRLQTAYGGPAMAAFHENILSRLQRDLGADLIPAHFRHAARVLDEPCRVEAHLVATAPTEIAVGGRTFSLFAGESIRTDLSWKYRPDAFVDLAATAGWRAVHRWTHPDELFCLHLLQSS